MAQRNMTLPGLIPLGIVQGAELARILVHQPDILVGGVLSRRATQILPKTKRESHDRQAGDQEDEQNDYDPEQSSKMFFLF